MILESTRAFLSSLSNPLDTPSGYIGGTRSRAYGSVGFVGAASSDPSKAIFSLRMSWSWASLSRRFESWRSRLVLKRSCMASERAALETLSCRLRVTIRKV